MRFSLQPFEPVPGLSALELIRTPYKWRDDRAILEEGKWVMLFASWGYAFTGCLRPLYLELAP